MLRGIKDLTPSKTTALLTVTVSDVLKERYVPRENYFCCNVYL